MMQRLFWLGVCIVLTITNALGVPSEVEKNIKSYLPPEVKGYSSEIYPANLISDNQRIYAVYYYAKNTSVRGTLPYGRIAVYDQQKKQMIWDNHVAIPGQFMETNPVRDINKDGIDELIWEVSDGHSWHQRLYTWNAAQKTFLPIPFIEGHFANAEGNGSLEQILFKDVNDDGIDEIIVNYVNTVPDIYEWNKQDRTYVFADTKYTKFYDAYVKVYEDSLMEKSLLDTSIKDYLTPFTDACIYQKKYNIVIQVCQKLLKLHSEKNKANKDAATVIYKNMGRVYDAKGDHAQALVYYKLAGDKGKDKR